MALRTFKKNVLIEGLISVIFALILKTAESRTCHYDERTKEATSPNYPNNYPGSFYCDLIIRSKPGCKIKPEFRDLQLEFCNNCGCDYVAFYDGETYKDPYLGKFCGSYYGRSIISTSHNILTVFSTDVFQTRRGFKIAYLTECAHFLPTTTSVQGLVINGDRANNNSDWMFTTDPDHTIKLELNYFPLPEFYDCNSNYVAFYDGFTVLDTLIGKFCSSVPPTFSSRTHQMLMVVKFKGILPIANFEVDYWAEFNLSSISDTTKRSFLDYFLNTRHDASCINKWGPDVARTAVALLLYDPQFFSPGNETGEEIAYELTLQLKSKLVLRKQISTADIALFVNALTAACIDPRNFFGVDIVTELRKRVDDSNYTNPFFILTLCNAGEKMEMEDVLLLQQLYGEYLRPSWTDVQAMVIMALKCISQRSNLDLDITLKEMVSQLKSKRQTNGMIDNLKNTALVTQAIIATENSKTDFNMSTAINSMLNYTKHSYVSFEEMYYILPILKWKTLLNISSDHCNGKIKTDLEDVPNNHIHKIDERVPVEFSIVIGDEMDFLRTWRVQVPSNYTFYQVLENITLSELNFKVRYVFLDGKPYVTGLSNFDDNTDTGKFWFIYAKSSSSGKNLTLLKKSPVDIQVKVTNNLLLWYKSLSWSNSQDRSRDVTNSPTYTYGTTESSYDLSNEVTNSTPFPYEYLDY